MRERSGKPTGADALGAIDARLGTLLDTLRAALGSALEGGGTSGTTTLGGDALRAEIRVKVGGLATGSAAAPRTEPRQPGRKPDAAPAAPAAPEVRTPILDIHESAEAWTVIVELPGVGPEEIDVAVEGPRVQLTTRGARRFAAGIDVPAGIDPGRLDIRMSNGILEITAPRGGEAADGHA